MRFLTTLLATAAVAATASAAVKTETVEYEFEGTKMKGVLAYDDAKPGKKPGVMVVHEWWGLNEDAKNRATMLAELGYVALAADMYGNAQVTEHAADAGKMATQVRSNMKAWLGRANAGLDVLRKSDKVDPTKLAVMGYCFGGSTSQLVAYSGAEGVKAVVSFHGALVVPTPEQAKAVKAKILICHGADDTFITADTITKFRKALDDAGTKYQFESYPGAVHSFTVKNIEQKGVNGLKYDEAADQKSWGQMKALFAEVFGR
jgi:dienelactone hydrolase